MKKRNVILLISAVVAMLTAMVIILFCLGAKIPSGTDKTSASDSSTTGGITPDIPEHEHVYGSDNACTVCGVLTEDVFTGVLLTDGTFKITAKTMVTYPRVVKIPSTYKGLPVTEITSDRGMQNNPNIEKVYIPEGVTKVTGLCNGCEWITEIYLPESLGTIENSFNNCIRLESVRFPDKMGVLNKSFGGCESLKSFNIPRLLLDITLSSCFRDAGEGCVVSVAEGHPVFYVSNNCIIDKINRSVVWGNELSVIPTDGSVTSIGNDAFSKCQYIKEMIIPETVTSIGQSAFFSCPALEKVYVPESVTEIGAGAFNQCISLKSLTLDCKIETIPQIAFGGCEKLEAITIPETVKTIGPSAFNGCRALKEIELPKSLTELGAGAFYNCERLESIVIPSGVSVIKEATFKNCKSLKNIEFHNGIVSIGINAFSYCNSLDVVVLPESVSTIGAYAFYNCEILSDIIIPSSVTDILEGALDECILLTRITYLGTMEQWNAIEKYDIYGACTVYCNNGEIPLWE